MRQGEKTVNCIDEDAEVRYQQMRKYTMQDPRPAAFDWFQDV